MTGPIPAPPFVQILVLAARSGLDWFSNPWAGGGAYVGTWTGDYELRRLQVKFSRTPTVGVVQDPAICTFHFLNLTGGNPDPSWITADYTAVESAFDTMFNTILGTYYNAEDKCSEYLWRADGPAFRPHGAGFSPTLRITPKNIAGNNAGAPLPPQVAATVTEVTEAHYTAFGVGVPGSSPGTGRTQVRNRWGRFYLPAPTVNVLTDGRWTTAFCSGVTTAVKAAYNACVAAQIVPVMYSPTTGNSFSITEVRCDDLTDVIRSRRYVTPLTRAPQAINAA